MVQILNDLRMVDVSLLLEAYSVGESIRRSSFDIEDWVQCFRGRRSEALRMGIASQEVEQAEEFVKAGFELTDRIISNGDFYPRNLIRLQDRVVLVDWAHWVGYRVCFVDYLANVAAFAYVHMWGNDAWQTNFIEHMREIRKIEMDDFRRAVLIKSFEQANYWLNNPQLTAQVQAQVNHFKRALGNTIHQ